jgi:ankyrin repeat protein
MKIKSLLVRLSYSPILLLAAVTLISLACTFPAFCGEVYEATRTTVMAKESLPSKGASCTSQTVTYLPLFISGSIVNNLPSRGEDMLIHKEEANGRVHSVYWPIQEVSIKDVAEILLICKFDINARDDRGLAPLHHVVKANRIDIAKFFLDKGADINVRDDISFTPLHWAAREGYEGMVELLLADKATVGAKDTRDYSPLHWAALIGHKEVVALLLAHNADINARNDRGYTPLRLAEMAGHEEVADLLGQHGGHE